MQASFEKEFDPFLLQVATETLGTLKSISGFRVTSESLEKYRDCLMRYELLRQFAMNVRIDGKRQEDMRKKTVGILKEIADFVESPENPYAVVQDPTRAKDLSTMLRAMTARGAALLS